MHKKAVIILLDGIGDRAQDLLKGKTPLQAARKPMLNKLAKSGINGLYHPTRIGEALPSEIAHFIMFGYDTNDFPGRGAIEALGADIELSTEDAAVLARFVSVFEKNSSLYLKDKNPAADDEATTIIEQYSGFQFNNIKITFHRIKKLTGVLQLKGPVSPYFTDTDPLAEGSPVYDIMPWEEYKTCEKTKNTVQALKAFLVHINSGLKNHPMNISRKERNLDPINFLATHRPGQLKKIIPFREKYGFRGLVIASGIVYRGLSRFLGMDFLQAEDTNDPGKDLAMSIDTAGSLLDKYDFIHIHTKAPDEAAHTKSPERKKSVIESLDRGIGKAIKPLLKNPNVLLAITADHSTPSSGPLIHSGEPVPLTFIGRGVRIDRVKRFDEISAAAGALGTMRGREFISLILNYLDRAKLLGLMDSPFDQPYWPGEYTPWRIDGD